MGRKDVRVVVAESEGFIVCRNERRGRQVDRRLVSGGRASSAAVKARVANVAAARSADVARSATVWEARSARPDATERNLDTVAAVALRGGEGGDEVEGGGVEVKSEVT